VGAFLIIISKHTLSIPNPLQDTQDKLSFDFWSEWFTFFHIYIA